MKLINNGGCAMATIFAQQADLLAAVCEQVNPLARPAAITFNSHITGLAVARSLGRRGVPIIALDRDAKGYALASKYTTVAGLCPNVLEDEEGFVAYLIELGKVLARPAVLFPTNDEWVLAVNRHRQRLASHFLIPFAEPEIVEPVLDKARLYRTAAELGIPIPQTWYLSGEPLDTIAQQLPYPCIVKPTEQRSFYDAFGDKAWRVTSPAELRKATQRAEGHLLVAQ